MDHTLIYHVLLGIEAQRCALVQTLVPEVHRVSAQHSEHRPHKAQDAGQVRGRREAVVVPGGHHPEDPGEFLGRRVNKDPAVGAHPTDFGVVKKPAQQSAALLPAAGRITTGRIKFMNQDLLSLSEKEMSAVRWQEIAMIFQDPMTSLNPLLTIGRQMTEAARLHLEMSASEADAKAVELLSLVGIPEPEPRMKAYPHQLSGGMRQRVMIAMALINEPKLLIAAQPTRGLDVGAMEYIHQRILQERERGAGILLISEDLDEIFNLSDRIVVLYEGRIMGEVRCEDATRQQVGLWMSGVLH